ncbi:MAG: DUF5131 family protein, partial [Nanoarchaeota archaeon]|nr:DUF5131 family protein [Nanoarchaeota archaeon]
MEHNTKIEWTHFPGYKGETWNPVTGCSHVSPGCDNCYAERISKRFGWEWGKPILHPERLNQPTQWKKPRAIFVCSMGDLFHESVSGQFIRQVVHQAENNPRHIFIILTKRPKQLLAWTMDVATMEHGGWHAIDKVWPSNVWLGVTAEDQQAANDRIPILYKIPSNHLISVEPMLGSVDVQFYQCPSCGKFINAWTSAKATRLQCDCGTSEDYHCFIGV